MAVNFFWASVNRLLFEISIMITVSRHNMDRVETLGGYDNPVLKNDPHAADAIKQSIDAIEFAEKASERLFAGLKCEHISRAVKSLGYLKTMTPFRWSELNARSRALRDAIETELKQYLYYQYPKKKGDKLRLWKEEWKASIAAFPAIEREVFDATDCYALGHNTASVFHSMRIAEHGLRALAKERRVRLPKNKRVEWATWQEIIRALDAEIASIGSKKAGGAKDSALEFYSGARADLNGFKDEYRNLVMHVRATYDEHQALGALTKVHAFMERLARKLDERGTRIRWGLR
jgi:hypothetical protein